MSPQKNKKVIAAMSGGVDSSVAAALLKEQGYDVIGITMQVWPSYALPTSSCGLRGTSRASEGKSCCSMEAVNDAKRVANKLGIPHYTLNFRDEFNKKVIDNFIEEYKNGRTPNPCIRCNQFLKFEHLMQKAKELDAKFVATGHYARVRGEGIGDRGKYKLLKGIDKRKDQAYVLYTLTQDQLAHALFPLGEMTKKEVREKAKQLDLPVADKAESQEICFIEDNDYVRYIKEKCPAAVKPGPIIDMSGKVVGQHKGIAFYTIGQRKGIGAHRGIPKYVVKIDPLHNAVVIGDKNDLLGKELTAREVNYISGTAPTEPLNITAKIRYNSNEADAVACPFTFHDSQFTDHRAGVVFKEPQRSITPGQSVVFYQGEEVIGGGIIS
ncbi:MAG: tRNA 2-thiouridine(34) synthase MnmA [Candidatus Margulisbacteria bacterium]|nr:tRNA 2-thiouridine(34) synthase MnmA [Candidatus Margulisiibacteriota bacterium]